MSSFAVLCFMGPAGMYPNMETGSGHVAGQGSCRNKDRSMHISKHA